MNPAIVFFILLYDFAVLVGTAYLVVVYDWNPWTFLAAMCVMVGVKSGKDDD
jgi:hypothetical protein